MQHYRQLFKMDEESPYVGISKVIKEYKDFQTLCEYNKELQQELTEHTTLLQEELKTARDIEKATDLKKNKCQIFLGQQEEVILKLLAVKEDNENLKQVVSQMEKTITDLKNSNSADKIKRDEDLQSFKQDYLKQLMKVQESANKQVLKEKNVLASTIEKLQSTITMSEELIKSQEHNIKLLKNENIKLKEKINADIITFQQKLVDQERKYQAELDTWKIAELNRTIYKLPLDKNPLEMYGNSSVKSDLFKIEHQRSLKNIQNQSTINHCRNSIPVIPNRPHHFNNSNSNYKKSSSFVPLGDIYFQTNGTIDKKDEDKEEMHIDSVDQSDQLIVEEKNRLSTGTNKKRKLFNHKENLLH